MSTPPPDTVVLVLPPLRVSGSKQLHCRVLATRAGRRVDIREFIDSDGFSGFTRRGLRLSLGEFEVLLEHQAEIRRLLGEVVAGEAANVESGGPGATP